MASFHTESFSGYSVEFNPFEDNKLACAASQNFGIVGNGRQYIFGVEPNGLFVQSIFDTKDCLFDCAWSEEHQNILITGGGDGSIKFWDTTLGDGRPLQSFMAHHKDIHSVDWNLVAKDIFVSGSADSQIKVWNPNENAPMIEYMEHRGPVYSTIWSPSSPDIFASASGDGTLKIWDINERGSVRTIMAHRNEVLTCDWNKYDENIIITGSVDRSIAIWDLRNSYQPMATLNGHDLAVRRVKCSPHSGSIIGSVSYDMSLVIWDTATDRDPLIERFDHYTEFVVGIDFNLFIEGQIATCAWDERVDIINI